MALTHFTYEQFVAHRPPQDWAADAARGITREAAYQQYLQINPKNLGAGNDTNAMPVAWDTAVDTSQNPGPPVTSVRADGSAPNIGNVVSPAQVAANIAGGGDKMMPITSASIQAGIANIGSYKRVPIRAGDQASVNAQIAAINAGSPLPAPQTSTSGSITSSNLQGGTSPLGTASSNSSSTSADSTVAGADATAKSIADYIKLLTPPDSATSNSVNDLISQISGDMKSLTGRGDAQLKAEQAQQVEQKKQTLQNYQTELLQKTAEYKSIQAEYQMANADVSGKPITMASITGTQAQNNMKMLALLNSKAADIAMIQANVSAAQGNLTLAQDAANRAVDLKYSDAKDAIDVRLKQLELLQGQLTKEEKIRSDAITLYLNDQKDKLAVQVANAKDKNATLLNQMQTYPDAGITLNDTIESANQKITTNSKIYKDRVKSLTGGGGKVGTAVTKKLIPAGLSQDEITHIDAGIKANGFQSVYDAEKAAGASPKKLSALQDAYGVKPVQTKEEVVKDMKSLFTTSELHQMSKDLGYASFWTGADTDIQRMFDSATMEQLVRKLSENVK